MVFDLVHVLRRETPIVVSQIAETGQAIAFDAPGAIDVRLKVAPDQLSQVAKQRLAAVQPGVSRAGNRSPQSIFLKNKKHVVQKVPRFNVKQKRLVVMLFQNHRGRD